MNITVSQKLGTIPANQFNNEIRYGIFLGIFAINYLAPKAKNTVNTNLLRVFFHLLMSAFVVTWPRVLLAQEKPSIQSYDNSIFQQRDIKLNITTLNGDDLCKSFAFSQIPGNSELFIGKVRLSANGKVCGGSQTLGLFRLTWSTLTMTYLHSILDIPTLVGAATIASAYDPYVERIGDETWVAFECTGLGIPGTTACVAPLLGNGHLDTSRLSMPVVGLDSNSRSLFNYSASTPKLLSFKQKLYLYWTAIQSDKLFSKQWRNIETRGIELEFEGSRKRLWGIARGEKNEPSYAPGLNIAVMEPEKGNPTSNTTVDTEGLFVSGDQIIVLSSLGGSGPDSKSKCVNPRDKSPGCFRLVISMTTNPLGENAFWDNVLDHPKLPNVATEYPRIIRGPHMETFLLVNIHPKDANGSDANIPDGYIVVSFPITALEFLPRKVR